MREHLNLSQTTLDGLAAQKLELVGLPPDAADKFPSELSGGMTKRVSLARALALDPEIVFLDEPTSGLDPISAGDFDDLIGTLQKTLGLTVFMVTHDLDSLYAICDRVAVLGHGKVSAVGSIDELLLSEDPWIKSYFHGKRGIVRAASAGKRRTDERRERSPGREALTGMETRANFVLIGAFTLGAVVAAFLFVMWIVGYGTGGGHRRYQIVFSGSVSGLSTGATVLFNGLKVGEVTGLGFVKGNASQVVADIDVTNASAPINADTKAQLETQGLTGSATVALIGGAKGGELTGNPPVIPSLPTATLADLQTKAGYVLDLANKLMVDNAQPIHKTIENVETFSLALANNSGGVDAALKGLADLGRTIEPLANRLQALSDDADRLVKAIDTEKVRAIVDNVQAISGKADSVLGRADKLLADNSAAIDFDDFKCQRIVEDAQR